MEEYFTYPLWIFESVSPSHPYSVPPLSETPKSCPAPERLLGLFYLNQLEPIIFTQPQLYICDFVDENIMNWVLYRKITGSFRYRAKPTQWDSHTWWSNHCWQRVLPHLIPLMKAWCDSMWLSRCSPFWSFLNTHLSSALYFWSLWYFCMNDLREPYNEERAKKKRPKTDQTVFHTPFSHIVRSPIFFPIAR